MPEITEDEIAVWEKKCRAEFEAVIRGAIIELRTDGKRRGYFSVHWDAKAFETDA